MAYGGTKAGTSGKYSQSGMQGSGKASVWAGNRGIIVGGHYPAMSDVIDYINIGTPATAIDFGNLSAVRISMAAVSSGVRACFAGGYTPGVPLVNIIEYITVASTGNAVDFGDINDGNERPGGASDGSMGIIVGGDPPFVDSIDYFMISHQSDATDFGELTAVKSGMGDNCSNGSRGMFFGGIVPARINTIEYTVIGRINSATDFGDCLSVLALPGATSDGSRAITFGGQSPSHTDSMSYVNMATAANAVDWGGELTLACSYARGASDGSRGIASGKYVNTPAAPLQIDYFPIGVIGVDAADFGDLSVARSLGGATSGD